MKNGRLKQSVCRWCYPRVDLDALAAHAKSIGLSGIDLLDPADFPTVQKHGLICSMTNSHGIDDGLNRKENHEPALAKIRSAIEASAEFGYPNVICFSGNSGGMHRTEGLNNCAEALRQIIPLAERLNITLCLEMLSSKRMHKDYMADNSAWAIDLVHKVGSERFKLLYDIFHMQIMEGDIIETIRRHHDCFAHYHTAGVPHHHELDGTQELNYCAIAHAIAEAGFTGYLAHEFTPIRDWKQSLAEAVKVCAV